MFSIVILITKGAIFITKRARKGELYKAPKEKSQLISLSLIIAVLLFIYLMASVSLLSEGPDNRNGMIIFGLLATISAAASFVFGVLQVKTINARLRTKTLRVTTLIASAAVLTNVLFWELFNFCSL